ncbi:hypothetical protein IO89_11480 [Epilithonimonas lactis]|uniref:Lipoprotein n=2 Tax=Epilithonimonas lactis TaxID=421072 RepID=A0A085BEG1_9FLAO|nr:hypothetical protein IO89_11480 [Epilithonimonas lactis]
MIIINLNFKNMKKSLFVAAIAAISLVACKKTDNVEAAAVDSVDATADSTVAAIDSTATATVDSVKATADSAKAEVKADEKATKDAIKK